MIQPTLEELFASPIRIKILKVFLRNPDKSFGTKEVSKFLRLDSAKVSRHLKNLQKIGFLKSKLTKSKKTFFVDSQFIFYPELENLVLKSTPSLFTPNQIKKLGKVKLAIITGIFLQDDAAPIDFLLVGDKIPSPKFTNFIKKLEIEVGSEIRYTLLSGKEFSYRYEMRDRFLREILDRRHIKIINKILPEIELGT